MQITMNNNRYPKGSEWQKWDLILQNYADNFMEAVS